MALPVLTAQSPVAGSFSWTGFTIVYGGQTFPISAGNTSAPYVYWRYSTRTPDVAQALTTSATLPVLSYDDLLLFVNRIGNPPILVARNLR